MSDPATKRCNKCGDVKPLAEFHRLSSAPDGRQYICKICRSEQDRRRLTEAREKEHRRQQRWRKANSAARRMYRHGYYAVNRESELSQMRGLRTSLREQVFGHYGTCCACCGTTERPSIDHIDGDGEAHRKQLFGGRNRGNSQRFYAWLINNGFPDGYQTLCRSCNASKGEGDRCRIRHC